jgi:hypothetical protein
VLVTTLAKTVEAAQTAGLRRIGCANGVAHGEW